MIASHSPVLLSDIPKSNVCFIKRIETPDKAKIEIINPDIDNTFGANIHSLYRESFFMKNGSMGSIATMKINEILKELNSDEEKNNKEMFSEGKYKVLENQISLIGEPVIRDSLMNLLISKHSDPRKMKIARLKNELASLEGNVEELKNE